MPAPPAHDQTPDHSMAGDSSREAAPAVRVLYIDVDDDLPMLLDRVEEAATPAIAVLPEGARAVRGTVAVRLLARRARAAGIDLLAVTVDRTAGSQLRAAGIECYPTVGDARRVLVAAENSRTLGNAPQVGNSPTEERRVPNSGPPADSRRSAENGLRETGVPSAGSKVTPPSEAVMPLPVPADAETARHVRFNAIGTDRSPNSECETAPWPSIALPAVDMTIATSVSAAQASGQGGATAEAHLESVWPEGQLLSLGGGRRWLLVTAAVLIAVAASAAAWIVWFPLATVDINSSPTTFSRLFRLQPGPGRNAALPLFHTGITRSLTRDVVGTGTVLVPGAQASGMVTFANPLNGVVSIPAGTILLAQSGLRFALTRDVQVPGAVHSFSGSTNGQANGPVRALTGGVDGNVAPGSIDSIEGRLSGAVLVTNYQAMAGGAMRTLHTVTDVDLAQSLQGMRQALAATEAATLNKNYAQSPARSLHAPEQVSLATSRFNRDGMAHARVTLVMRTGLDYLHASDARAAALRLQQDIVLRAKQEVVARSLRAEVLAGPAALGQSVAVRVTGATVSRIDSDALAARLPGKSVDEARRMLLAAGKRGGWNAIITTIPGWGGRLPITARLIHLRVHGP